MKAKDEQKWSKYVEDNKTTGYAKAVIRFAIAWADLMEKEISENGKSVKECAKATSYMAFEETGSVLSYAQYGYARRALCDFWEYGTELNEWAKEQDD